MSTRLHRESKCEAQIVKQFFIALRPKQWIKNLLVFSAPVAAGVIQEEIVKVFLGFLAFCFASSLGYLTNDWRDRKLDRLHPQKKSRPFASRSLTKKDFLILISLCTVFVLFLSSPLPGSFSLVIFIYLVISLSYTFFIKNISVVELIWLSSGFLLRALSGSAIIGEPPTGWFVISIFFGSLFIVSTKRFAEKSADHKSETRRVLKTYSERFLGTSITTSLTITLITYSLWVFQVHNESIVAQFSIIPFSLLLLTYANFAEKSRGESPEDLFLGNLTLVLISFITVSCLIWVTYFD